MALMFESMANACSNVRRLANLRSGLCRTLPEPNGRETKRCFCRFKGDCALHGWPGVCGPSCASGKTKIWASYSGPKCGGVPLVSLEKATQQSVVFLLVCASRNRRGVLSLNQNARSSQRALFHARRGAGLPRFPQEEPR